MDQGLRKQAFLSANLRQSSRILNRLVQISEDGRNKTGLCVSSVDVRFLDFPSPQPGGEGVKNEKLYLMCNSWFYFCGTQINAENADFLLYNSPYAVPRDSSRVFKRHEYRATRKLRKVSYLYTCGLTQCGRRSPFSPAIRLFAAIHAMFPRAVTLALAMCGAMTRFSSVSRG